MVPASGTPPPSRGRCRVACRNIRGLPPAEAALVIGVVERAFAKIVRAQASPDEDERSALHRLGCEFLFDIGQGAAQDGLVWPTGMGDYGHWTVGAVEGRQLCHHPVEP